MPDAVARSGGGYAAVRPRPRVRACAQGRDSPGSARRRRARPPFGGRGAGSRSFRRFLSRLRGATHDRVDLIRRCHERRRTRRRRRAPWGRCRRARSAPADFFAPWLRGCTSKRQQNGKRNVPLSSYGEMALQRSDPATPGRTHHRPQGPHQVPVGGPGRRLGPRTRGPPTPLTTGPHLRQLADQRIRRARRLPTTGHLRPPGPRPQVRRPGRKGATATARAAEPPTVHKLRFLRISSRSEFPAATARDLCTGCMVGPSPIWGTSMYRFRGTSTPPPGGTFHY